MNYSIHGPFPLPKSKQSNLISNAPNHMKKFWAKIAKDDSDIENACGCYVFAINAGKGCKPWYVGLAAKQPFGKEILTSHKLNIYNEASSGQKGTAIIYLLARKTDGGKPTSPSAATNDISFLEKLLIAKALEKNPDLANIKNTKFLREMVVPRILNTSKRRPSKSEHDFQRMITKHAPKSKK
jgi:hypothetical protein